MPTKKLRPREPLVPQAMRRAVMSKLPQIARLLDLDAHMGNDELYAEVLRLCLFSPRRYRNPAAIFEQRLNNGDFLLVQEGEDPDNLAPNREPMTLDELDIAVAQISSDYVFWNGKCDATAADIVCAVMLLA